ncbi:MAG: hypothetical protein ACREDR_40105, partial [Blastocatellia bacterium]
CCLPVIGLRTLIRAKGNMMNNSTVSEPLLTMLQIAVCAFLLLAGLTVAGCDSSASLRAPETTPKGPNITVEPGKTIPIRVNAQAATTYEWQLQGDGKISSPSGPAILYTAPGAADTAVITVVARKDGGTSAPTVVTIDVAPIASVNLDALGIPAGWMSGSGDPATFIDLMSTQEDCHSGGNCLQFTYKRGGVFAGICWWPQGCGTAGTPDAWDRVRKGTCGANVLQEGNLTEVKRLSFWARGGHGGEKIEFKVGASDIKPRPGRSLGKVTLGSKWEQHEIDLQGVDMTDAIGLFIWTASDLDNPNGAVFYLDDIKFEGVRRKAGVQ